MHGIGLNGRKNRREMAEISHKTMFIGSRRRIGVNHINGIDKYRHVKVLRSKVESKSHII